MGGCAETPPSCGSILLSVPANAIQRLAQPPSAPTVQVTLYYLLLGALLTAVLWLFPGAADYIPIDAKDFIGWGAGADVFEPNGLAWVSGIFVNPADANHMLITTRDDGVFESFDAAIALHGASPEWDYVTKEGDIVRRDGVITGGEGPELHQPPRGA